MAMKHPAHPGKIIKHAIEATGLSVTTEEHAARVQAATARVMRNHDAALKKLAD